MGDLVCRRCKGTKYVLDENNEMVMCSCFKSKIRIKQPRIALKKMNIDPDFATYDIKEYYGDKSSDNIKLVHKFINEFDTKYRGASLYFFSELNGTQKTTLAKYALRELQKRGKSGYLVTMGELTSHLTEQSFKSDADSFIAELRQKDVLVIDDAFDVKKVTVYSTGWQFSFLDTFLREFVEVKKKSIIFTSNIPIRKIKDTFSVSIAALIERTAYPIEFLDKFDENRFKISNLFDD